MSCLSRIRAGLVLTFALSLPAAASGPVQFPDETAIRDWTAQLYWSNVVPQPEATEPSGREALASGRQPLVAAPVTAHFVALPPCRLVDTRGNGAPLTGGFLPPTTVRDYVLTGVCGIPANAQAVSLNATVVSPTGPGFLTLWPQNGAYPPVSTLNYVGNDIVANAAVVPLGAGGAISMALGVSGGDVILDTNGYYAAISNGIVLNAYSGAATGNVTKESYGCRGLDPAAASSLALDIPLPIGAVITGVKIRTTLPMSNAPLTAYLRKMTWAPPSGMDSGASATLTVPAYSSPAVTPLTGLSTTTPASEMVSYYLVVSAPAHTAVIYFCGASVQYTLN